MSPIMIIAIIVFIPSINAQASMHCTDENQCQSYNIQNAIITCSGEESCINTTLISDAKKGYVKCSALSSCGDCLNNGAANIKATKNVYCSGLKSCATATILAKSLECTGYYGCKNYDYNSENPYHISSSIKCGGGDSCDGATWQVGKMMYCDAYRACVESTITGGVGANCDGYSSCYMSSIKNQKKFISCAGSGSCSASKIRKTAQLKLYGYSAGFRAAINQVKIIRAYGTESLKKATVDSDGVDKLLVEAFGELAGNEAIVTCRFGSECKVSCLGTGCLGLAYICETGATCDIIPGGVGGCQLDNSVDAAHGISCPDVTIGSSSFRIMEKEHVQIVYDDDDYSRSAVIEFEPESKLKSNKLRADADMVCGTESECDGQTLNTGSDSIYCTGKSSCNQAIITTNADESSAKIHCDGESSCFKGTLTSHIGAVRCNGEAACKSSSIMVKNLYCYGFESCYEAALSTPRDEASGTSIIGCVGDSSCYGSTLTNSGQTHVYCTGTDSCIDSSISTQLTVYCDGGGSCKLATITAGTIIKCIGKYSCSKAISLSANTISIKGSYGAMRATLNADIIEGLGYNSLCSATIDSIGRDAVTVRAYGHSAGSGATFTCRSNSECTLVCKGTGCDGLIYVCVNGAICNIDPVECETGNRDQFEGIDCPRISTPASDKEVDAFMEEKNYINKEFYAKLDEYIMENRFDDDDDEVDIDDFLLKNDERMEFFGGIGIMHGYMGNLDESTTKYVSSICGVILWIMIFSVYLCYRIKSQKGDYETLV